VRVQVIAEGTQMRDKAAELLHNFRRDYPTLVRAVKTRATSQTVLMHKNRFVQSMVKAGLLEEKEGNQLLVRAPCCHCMHTARAPCSVCASTACIWPPKCA
jgi:hypothetical protein